MHWRQASPIMAVALMGTCICPARAQIAPHTEQTYDASEARKLAKTMLPAVEDQVVAASGTLALPPNTGGARSGSLIFQLRSTESSIARICQRQSISIELREAKNPEEKEAAYPRYRGLVADRMATSIAFQALASDAPGTGCRDLEGKGVWHVEHDEAEFARSLHYMDALRAAAEDTSHPIKPLNLNLESKARSIDREKLRAILEKPYLTFSHMNISGLGEIASFEFLEPLRPGSPQWFSKNVTFRLVAGKVESAMISDLPPLIFPPP